MSQDRAIGPLGTASRILCGVGLLVLAGVGSEVGWWELAAGLLVLPLIAAVFGGAAAYAFPRRAPKRGADGSVGWSGRGLFVIIAVIAAGVGLTFITPADGAGPVWIFLGVSMLIGAMRGFAGCEVLAIPNALTGRYHYVPCLLFSPIDLWEDRHRSSRAPASTG